jgi:hypothetical protein
MYSFISAPVPKTIFSAIIMPSSPSNIILGELLLSRAFEIN